QNTSCTPPNGTATANVSNGMPLYSYLWSVNAGSQTGQTATGLPGGNYAVTVTDANGCTGTTSVLVTSTTITVDVNLSATPVTSCLSANGSITANVTGGSGNYSYDWNNGDDLQVITDLAAGTYTVTVTDIPTSC